MTVRAKFKVTKLEKTLGYVSEGGKSVERELTVVHLQPVYGNGDPTHENTRFFAFTPSGAISMGMVPPDTAAQFVLGKEYYVDFTAPGAVEAVSP